MIIKHSALRLSKIGMVPRTYPMLSLSIIFSFLFFSNLSLGGEIIPEWVKKRPIFDDYYVGISSAAKSAENMEHIQTANNNALYDLSTQIKVKISGTRNQTIIERSGIVEEEFESYINSSTIADFKNHELVDTWEDKDNYWVYYRLSKVLYAEQRKKRIENAIILSKDKFARAKVYEKKKSFEQALSSYAQALYPIDKYFTEPLETIYGDAKIFLLNEIYFSIQDLLNHIQLEKDDKEVRGKVGRPLDKPLMVSAVYVDSLGVRIPVSYLPLKFSFTRGSGELAAEVRTDRSGKASCTVNKITSGEDIQIVKVELDLFRFRGHDSVSVVLKSVMKSLSIPSTIFELNVLKLSAFVSFAETNLAELAVSPYIEPAFKSYLSLHGIVFVDSVSEAEIVINVKADSRKGSRIVERMFSAYANLSISMVKKASGEEIYKGSVGDVKGIGLDFEQAGLKALKNVAKKMQERLLPEVIKQI